MRPAVAACVLLVACGGEKAEPAPTPGPRWPAPVAFAAEDARLDIYVRDATGVRQLTDGPRDEFSPSWSPDGKLIAYRVNPPRGDEGDIWTMRADGTGKRNLTRSPGVADWSPAFSPDSKRIAYMSAHELWEMEADGSGQRQLTQAGELSEYPSWSPDGRALAFSGVRGGNFEVVRLDGGAERNLTGNPANDKWPAWSPDGTRIAFMSDRDGDDDVFLMDAKGGGVRNVTRSPLHESHPSWTPDGRLTFLQHGESGPVHVRVLDPAGAYNLPIDAVFAYDWGA